MRVPGSNLLNRALRVIARQTVDYYAFSGRSVNSIGLDVSTYADAVSVAGSLQPVPRTLYKYMGLDLQRNYYNFYVPKTAVDVARDVSGDQLVYAGRRLECLSKTEWFDMDGWLAILTVEVPVEEEV